MAKDTHSLQRLEDLGRWIHVPRNDRWCLRSASLILELHLTIRLCILFAYHHLRIGIHGRPRKSPFRATLGSSIRLCNGNSLCIRPGSPPLPLCRTLHRNRPHRLLRPRFPRSPHISLLRRSLPRCPGRVFRHADYRLLVQHKPRWPSQAVCRIGLASWIREYWRYYRGVRVLAEYGATVRPGEEYLYWILGAGDYQLLRVLGWVSMGE
jgi:hypothetical protein